MARDVRVGVAGATGALGKEIISVLDAAPWRPTKLVPLASARTVTPFVDYGAEQLAVDDLKDQSLGDLDILIVAVPRDVAGPLVDAAVQAGLPVVDCSGSQSTNLEVPCVVPWLNPEVLHTPRPRDVVSIPSAPAVLLASALAPLSRAGWRGDADATVMVPASHWGRDGIEELSRQVVALFNSGTAPRKVFESGLAFDLLPAVGEPASSGWTNTELQAVAEVARIAGARANITCVGAPLFSGSSATLRISVEPGTESEHIARILRDGGVRGDADASARRMARPRRVEGQAFAHASRIRVAPDGGTAHIWLAMDNLRTVASAAVATAAMVLGPEEETGDGPVGLA